MCPVNRYPSRAALGVLTGLGLWFLGMGVAWGQDGSVAVVDDAFQPVPHQGVYTIALDKASPDSGVVGARGVMRYRLMDRCDGWTWLAQMRVDLAVGTDGGTIVIEFNGWGQEAADGLSYSFLNRSVINGEEQETYAGHARLAAAGGAGQAVFVSPEPTVLELPPGTVFPMAAMRRALSDAAEGQSSTSGILFGGDDHETLQDYVTAMSGSEETDPVKLAEVTDPDLLRFPGYRMATASYEHGGIQQTPLHEYQEVTQPNAISRQLILGFDGFSLQADLTDVTVLQGTDCP